MVTLLRVLGIGWLAIGTISIAAYDYLLFSYRLPQLKDLLEGVALLPGGLAIVASIVISMFARQDERPATKVDR